MKLTRRTFVKAAGAGAAVAWTLRLGRPCPAGEAAPPLKVLLISASDEYKSNESLGAFQKFLESSYNAACTRAFGTEKDKDLPGLENLDATDVMFTFTRRFTLPPAQLERVKKYCQAGRPIVGVRTASHGFQNWLEFDKEVLGGNYTGHYGKGPPAEIAVAGKAGDHPILAGFRPYKSPASLYKNTGAAADIELLLTGAIPDHTEPLAWTRVHNGGRVFYTSLGAPEDFANEDFRRMLAGAVFWAAKRKPETRAAV